MQRPAELSELLAGADTEGDENRDKAYGLGKMLPTLLARMGWYKVPRQSFDYGSASLDSILFERGVKEPEGLRLETAMLIRIERETRTLQLISSFGDMAGAAARAIIKEARESPDLEPRLRDTFQGLLDLE